KCCDHGLDLCISIDFIQPCFLYIEDFSSQRKDSLRRAVSRSLSGTAGGISLYDIDFTFCRIFIRTVCKFSRKRCSLKSRFSSRKISCLPCRFPCPLSHHRFFNRDLCHIRILLKENLKLCAQNTADSSSCFTVSQFLLCLSFKLRIFNLYADDRG